MASMPRLAALLAVLAVAAALTAPAPVQAQEDVGGLTVFAGTGEEGFSGDGGPAATAMLNRPFGIAVAPDGTVYISDSDNHRVRAVAQEGTISTVVGSGRDGTTNAAVLAAGARGADVDLSAPTSLAVGPDGTLYVADAELLQVFALAPDGRLSVLAGTGRPGPPGDGGPATSAALGQLGGLAAGPDGTVYVGDLQFHRVRAVSPDGTITTVAGNGGERSTAAGGDALAVPVPFPYSLAVDAEGTLWVVSGSVQRVSGGRLATVVHAGDARDRWTLSEEAGRPSGYPPTRNALGVSVAADAVYLFDASSPDVVVRLDADGMLSTVAELDPLDDLPSGPMAVAASGVAYLVDNPSHRVYSIRLAEPAPPAPSGGGPVPWWPFAAAGAVVTTSGGWWMIRRRRPG